MDYRKLIQFGKSSYVISVPNNWIKKNKLNKGDTVYLSENGNNELVLNPSNVEKKKELKNISIEVDNKDLFRVKRELISSYLNGYNIVKISGKELNKYSNHIRNTVNESLMGFEIIEQNKKYLIIKDLLDLSQVSINDTLRKLDIGTRLMFSEMRLINNPGSYKTLVAYESDVNKHMFLLIRFVREILCNPSLAKNLNLNQKEVLEVWQISHHIERIADKLKYLALEIKKIKNKDKTWNDIFKIYSKIESYYLDVMKAYYNKDIPFAYKLSYVRDDVHELCNNMYNKNKDAEYSPETFFLLKALVSSVHKIVRRTYS